MSWAEFEEKEYEAPLYNQLEAGHPNVWSPGQVFEHHIGIDRGSFVNNPRFWRHIGFRAARRGSVLNRYDFDFIPSSARRPLPDFRMNIFIQAKRCERLHRVRRDIKGRGIPSPCYRFTLDEGQRDVLAEMANTLGYHSYVCYAAPAFHTLEQLYLHTGNGSVVYESTFPSATNLVNHTAWYYSLPGASGVANPQPESIKGSGLISKIQELLDSPPEGASPASENLAKLAASIVSSVKRTNTTESPRRAIFFNELRLIDKDTADMGFLREEIRNFLQVNQFAKIFNIEWYAIG